MRPQFDHLATYSDSSRPSVTRMVFSDWDVQARGYIKGLMKEAGLTVREDVMGNTFGRWEGSDPSAGAVARNLHSMLACLYAACLVLCCDSACLFSMRTSDHLCMLRPVHPITKMLCNFMHEYCEQSAFAALHAGSR